MNKPNHSAIFDFADRLVDQLAARDPLFATEVGMAEYADQLPDFSLAHQQEDERLLGEHLATVAQLDAVDDVDRVARDVIVERLSSERALLASGEWRRTFSVLNSPVSAIRQTFELMAAETPSDVEVIVARLHAVAPSLESWRGSLRDATADGLPPRRQVRGVAEQTATYANGAYAAYAARVAASAGVDLVDSGLAAAADQAQRACGDVATWLGSLAERCVESDGCGRERYAPWASYWTGAALDFDELYQWGWEESRRLHDRMVEVAAQIAPGRSLRATAAYLDHDPAQLVRGTDALLERLRGFVDDAAARLDGVHFDIDPRVRFCDVRIAPEGSAAAPYYIPSSEDLSRPGTTWYPTLGANEFAWWRFPSTWYHEAIPGHHLQFSASLLAADRLTRFHRLRGWTSGYGEGWALYAERFMDELGAFDEPAYEFDFLANQSLRANRVVVDVGLHLGLAAPQDLGTLGELGDCSGQPWNAAMAVALLEEWAIQEPGMASSEVDRYLGLPGQAIAYKVGERRWLDVRAETRDRLGAAFDMKSFHRYALELGPLGLDLFAEEMRRFE